VELVVTVGNTDTKAIADISAAVSIISAALARKLNFFCIDLFGQFKMLPLGVARQKFVPLRDTKILSDDL
jgi:hypothetical protein